MLEMINKDSSMGWGRSGGERERERQGRKERFNGQGLSLSSFFLGRNRKEQMGMDSASFDSVAATGRHLILSILCHEQRLHVH